VIQKKGEGRLKKEQKGGMLKNVRRRKTIERAEEKECKIRWRKLKKKVKEKEWKRRRKEKLKTKWIGRNSKEG
jgi:hypothetical protein